MYKRQAVRGFGKTQPLVKEGDVEEQAPNRRVEIKMRKGLPPKETVSSPKPTEVAKPVAEEEKPPQPPKALVEEEPAASRAEIVPEDEPQLVFPRRAIPVEE